MPVLRYYSHAFSKLLEILAFSSMRKIFLEKRYYRFQEIYFIVYAILSEVFFMVIFPVVYMYCSNAKEIFNFFEADNTLNPLSNHKPMRNLVACRIAMTLSAIGLFHEPDGEASLAIHKAY